MQGLSYRVTNAVSYVTCAFNELIILATAENKSSGLQMNHEVVLIYTN